MSEIRIVENVLKANDDIAAENRRRLSELGIFTIDLIGSPGCGKTTLLEQTLRQTRGALSVAVIVGDLATTRDAARLHRWCEHVVQINTNRGCHLEAHQVRQALERLPLAGLDVLIIENVGNLICPVGFDLGQNAKVGMFSVTEGDDKAAKHPHLVCAADLILLNKVDLLDAVKFNEALITEDIRQLNAVAPLHRIDAAHGEIEPWLAWLRSSASSAESAGHRKMAVR
jgi:hydrogenase nickel incorporation protein HypB